MVKQFLNPVFLAAARAAEIRGSSSNDQKKAIRAGRAFHRQYLWKDTVRLTSL